MTGSIQTNRKSRRGFTLTEVLIASSIGFMVSASIVSTFIWTGKQSSLCSKIAWSQTEAMRTSGKIESYLRNAQCITAIDQTNGNWVEVRFVNGTTNRFTYYNAPNTARDGKMYLTRTNTQETLVAYGLTKIMSTNGYPQAMFTKINERAIRVAFRVSEPTPNGNRASDDELYFACARFAVCLRNATY